MTAKKAYHMLAEMLGLKAEQQFAEATLVDGTIVKTDGDLVEGAQLLVSTPDGDIPATEGMYETDGGLILTVDAQGIIVSIEEKGAEEPAEPVEPAEPAPAPAAMAAEFTLEDVANVIKPLVEQVNALNEELSAVKASFNAFKEEPAAGRITSASVAKNEGEGAASKRLEFLASLRNKKK